MPSTTSRKSIIPPDEAPGTIIIYTRRKFLYLIEGNGKALRYGIGVGRDGFKWYGTEKIARKAKWPDWHPPKEMRVRDPSVPAYMPGGEGNPLGARAMYLGNSLIPHSWHGAAVDHRHRGVERLHPPDQRQRHRPL